MIDGDRPRRDPPTDAPTLAIGLMSGTSADGIDGVLLLMSAFDESVSHELPAPEPTSLDDKRNFIGMMYLVNKGRKE